jgi:hypothetical protein
MKIGIVIQGPLHDDRCVNLLIENYSSQKSNCIISTWDDQPIELIQKLIDNDFPLLINKREDVDYVGWSNCNLQFYSSAKGISRFLDTDYTHVLKIRTDTIPSKIDNFLEILYNKSADKITFMCWITGMEIEYFIDFFSFGPKEKVYGLWNIYQSETTNPMFTEQYLLYKNLGITKPTYQDIKNEYNFCLKEMFESDIRLDWEKPSYRNKGDYVRQYYLTINNESCVKD